MQIARAIPIIASLPSFDCDQMYKRFSNVRREKFDEILSKIPSEWIPASVGNQMSAGWDTFVEKRLDEIKKYVNGLVQP